MIIYQNCGEDFHTVEEGFGTLNISLSSIDIYSYVAKITEDF
jgi:hypothetical protein